MTKRKRIGTNAFCAKEWWKTKPVDYYRKLLRFVKVLAVVCWETGRGIDILLKANIILFTKKRI